MSCYNCRTMVDILKKEVMELSERQQSLVRINNALMDALKQKEQATATEEQAWKDKYEHQLAINLELEKKLKQLHTHQLAHHYDSCSPEDLWRPNMSSRSSFKENCRSGSVTKMDRLMQTLVGDKTRMSSQRRKLSSAGVKSKREIVLRIVDDRLNRHF